MMRMMLMGFCLVWAQFALALSHTVEISEKEIQQKVTAMMPIQKKLFLATVSLPDPRVSLISETNEIGISSPVEVSIPGVIKGSGRAKIQGVPSYDARSGEFFLKSPAVTEFEVDGLPERYRAQVRELTQLLVEQVLAKRPIYKLNDDDLQHRLAKSVLQSVAVKNDKLLLVLEIF
ncbi:hypothetical protein BH11PSE11_BH11PSE11_03040 [soil metagenome]